MMRRWTDSTGRAASPGRSKIQGDPQHRAPHFTEPAFPELQRDPQRDIAVQEAAERNLGTRPEPSRFDQTLQLSFQASD